MSDADGSYDVADEAKEDVVDRFDSDFNDFESSEDENDGEGAIEDDIRNVKRKSIYSDLSPNFQPHHLSLNQNHHKYPCRRRIRLLDLNQNKKKIDM